MPRVRITTGGQVSIPAALRRRWGVAELELTDLGDRLVLRPVVTDPVDAAEGILAGRIPSAAALRARARADEAAAERRRARALS